MGFPREEQRDGTEGPSFKDTILKKYFPERFEFEPFGDPHSDRKEREAREQRHLEQQRQAKLEQERQEQLRFERTCSPANIAPCDDVVKEKFTNYLAMDLAQLTSALGKVEQQIRDEEAKI